MWVLFTGLAKYDDFERVGEKYIHHYLNKEIGGLFSVKSNHSLSFLQEEPHSNHYLTREKRQQ